MSYRLTYDDLRREIGLFLGTGRTDTQWDDTQEADIEAVLSSGLKKFYYNAINPQTGQRHTWSFITRVETLELVANEQTYKLPDDFERIVGPFTYPAGSGKRPVGIVDDQEMRNIRSRVDETGDPLYAEVSYQDFLKGDHSLQEVTFYPRPTAATKLEYRMMFDAVKISATNPYPYGSTKHSEAILKACLAAAEEKFNPESGPGTYAQAYEKLLFVAIEEDAQIVDEGREPFMYGADALNGEGEGLGINKAYLLRLTGEEMGYGGNANAWTYGDAVKVNEALRDGLRTFYNPQPINNEQYGHQWNFLKMQHEMTLQADVYEYELPPTFAIYDGIITYPPGSETYYPAIDITNPESIRRNLQSSNLSTGRPFVGAYEAVSTDESRGTLWKLLIWPVPDQAYPILVRWRINPDNLDTNQELPYGGPPHAQTLIASCLAAAERRTGEGNVRKAEYERLLRTSISHDRMQGAPDFMGYIGDRSDRWYDEYGSGDLHDYDQNLITHSGHGGYPANPLP